MTVDRQEVEEFLYHEADLMDRHQYDDWEALWTDDAIYWVPAGSETSDPIREVAIIYDNRQGLSMRIQRMKSNLAWSQDPKSHLSRVISNIRIKADDNGEITVHSNFHLDEWRRRGQKTWQYAWAGKSVHKLRQENGHLKMAYKQVVLVNNDDAIPTLWFLI